MDWSLIDSITGGSFTGTTLIVNDCSLIYSPSNAVITTRLLPLQFGAGAIVNKLLTNTADKFPSNTAL